LPEAVAHVVAAAGLRAHYLAEKDGADRLDNLAELVSAADTFLREADLAVDAPIAREAGAGSVADAGAVDPLSAFLAHAALEAGEMQEAEGRAALQLMSVHAAKGLEFHTVFVTGLEEGLFPHENSLSVPDGVEEERRLMYVAMTRAKRRLYLTLAQSRTLYGQPRHHVASRFLDELPRELVQWLSPRRPRAYAASVDIDVAEWGRPSPAGGAAGRAGALPPRAAPAAGASWRIGQSVRHARFGLGVVVDAEGRGGDARVQVNFRDVGVKWLALEYAKLEPA
jgi:DNA helicase-2/ATP-dependent DNA helicase PcrA